MTKLTQTILISLFAITSLMAQSIIMEKHNESAKNDTYVIDAHKYLVESDKMVSEYLKNNPNYFEELKLQKKTAWNFTVGSTKSWFASDFTAEIAADQIYSVPSTCRAVGTNCYVFVEDDIWNSRVSQENANAVMQAFDNSTPANSNKGIYNTVVETFGSPPDVDGDPKIIILILDIKDGFSGSGGYTAGYFHSLNEIDQTGSNMAEMYYMDANPADLSTEGGLNAVLSTTAHEFQHMIHFNYHNGTPDKIEQITFFNEGSSEVSEVVCGYPVRGQSGFNSEYNHYLIDWRDGDAVLKDYARAARYFTYFYDQFGVEFLKNFVQSKSVGTIAISDALANLTTPTTLRFKDSLVNWFLANAINDKSINSSWGYNTANVNTVSPLVQSNPNYSSPTITVEKIACDYFKITTSEKFSINFDNFNSAKLKFKAIKYNNDVVADVEDITPNTPYDFNDGGTIYTSITFAAYNTSEFQDFNYSYTSTGATGAIVLEYDINKPSGVLPLTVNDTVSVAFDGVPGGRLDSIRVALRQAGSVSGGIYKFNSALSPSALGSPLFPDLTVTSNIAERPVYNEETESYPIPFPNWITVDLTSQNIDASEPFAAAFLVEGTYEAPNYAQRIMISEQPNSNNHSFSYLNEPSSGTPGWYVITASEANAYAYLIKAYVSFGVTDVEEQTVELLPTNFELEQNYPNPFNPNTNISFNLPNNSFVDLAVYNSLGEKVSTLVNKDLSAGNYSYDFDGANLSSGVYYYKLISGSFVETKKMILMK